MKEDYLEPKVTCYRCETEFKIDVREFNLDNDLTCPKCGLIFTPRDCLIDSLKETTKSLKETTKSLAKVLKIKISEAEKGNTKMSPKELDKAKNLLAKHKL